MDEKESLATASLVILQRSPQPTCTLTCVHSSPHLCVFLICPNELTGHSVSLQLKPTPP